MKNPFKGVVSEDFKALRHIVRLDYELPFFRRAWSYLWDGLKELGEGLMYVMLRLLLAVTFPISMWFLVYIAKEDRLYWEKQKEKAIEAFWKD